MDGAPRAPAASRFWPRTLRTLLPYGVVIGAAGVSGVQWTTHGQAREAAALHRPVAVEGMGYASSDSCRSCHPNQYASWFASYHRTMTQVASPASVHGDFSNASFGDTPFYRLGRTGDQFFFETADTAEQPPLRRPISLVTGSHHMQIYWYETGNTRKLGQVPFVYLNADQRWVPRATVFLEPPAPMRRPDESGRWSRSCITCHTTQGRPHIDAQGQFDTQVAEFGIACEACHGPGREHVEQMASPLARYREHFVNTPAPAIVQPKRLDHRRASEICSQCHSQWQDQDEQAVRDWNQHGFAYRPGEDAAASRWLLQPSQQGGDPRIAQAMREQPGYVLGQFWSDGMARVSGREFSGMIDSPCYLPGKMSCLSCHTMHKPAEDPRSLHEWADDQLSVGMDGDHACLQCHESFAEKLSTHTRHAPASAGSRCYNCHMPNTSYGLLKAMRSHRISVPSVAETVETGRPNACNLCHLDRSLGWTAEKLKESYGIESPTLTDDQQAVELGVWLGLTGDAGQRALIAAAMGWAPAQAAADTRLMAPLLGVLMDDPYDAVRYIAQRSLRSFSSVDADQLQYDFVPRPSTRAPVAARVASLARPALPPDAAARFTARVERLLPQRNERRVLLLE